MSKKNRIARIIIAFIVILIAVSVDDQIDTEDFSRLWEKIKRIDVDFSVSMSHASDSHECFVIDRDLNFRSAPGLNSQVLTTIPNGVEVEPISEELIPLDELNWVNVQYGTYEGWIASDYATQAECNS